MTKLDLNKIDFEHCADEPIHIPETIQEYGFFFGLNPDTHKIQVYSANHDQLFNQKADVFNCDFFDLFNISDEDKDFIKDSYKRAKDRDTRLPVELAFHIDHMTDKNQTSYHAVVYYTQGMMVFEIEPHVKFIKSNFAKQYSKLYSANISPKYKEMDNVGELAQSITDTVKKLTGYERVVIYMFNPDNSGKVIAESKVDDMESYLNLYYPAGDIPHQARELYKKNWIRLTPDVNLTPIPLLPSVEEAGRERIDLSKSLLRSMSPIHLQYVKNQGLKSSMSISLVTHGELWGLISCHHREKHYIPQNIRIDCEELSQLFSWQLYAKEEELRLQRKTKIEEFVDSILAELSEKKSIVEVFRTNESKILEAMNVSGFIFNFNGRKLTLGEIPDEDTLELLQSQGESDEIRVWKTSKLEDSLNLKEGTLAQKGALYIPLTKEHNCYTAWFRDEKVKVQRWAGTPEEKTFKASKKERLTPRKSFKVHEVKINNTCEDWTKTDVEIVEKFHKLFLSFSLSQQEVMQENISFLEEKDQTKDQFLATLAHELRNPLSPMENAITLLEEMHELSQDEINSALTILKRQQNQLGSLVDDLLDVSQITRRRMRMKIERVNLQELIEAAVSTAQGLIKRKNQSMSIQMDNKDIFIRGDFSRLLQALGNIINNASKYSEQKGSIEISVEVVDKEATIHIKDDGMGISQENLDHIFDMFSQVDTSENTRGGLGIGLTLTKKILELHEGRIDVASEGVGKGTTMSVTLPLAETHSDNDRPVETVSKLTRLKGAKVLIVDDNADILSSSEFLLKRKGLSVVTAINGEKGLEEFEKLAFDFVVLDIGLPDITGYSLCRRMNQIIDSQNSIRPIFIAQSGWGQPEDMARAKAAGFDRHLTKPVKVKDLYSTMEELLKKF